jgi:serum/glucocorticoid-regulated kinase 2
VRTDDLESTRVERAIKRVRSDLAAHAGNAAPLLTTTAPPSNRTSTISAERGRGQEGNGLLGAPPLTPDDASADENARRLIASGMVDFTAPSLPTPAASPIVHRDEPKSESAPQPALEPEEAPKEEPSPEVPAEPTQEEQGEGKAEDIDVLEEPKAVVEEHPSRIPRSASADPDKATRLSRVWQDLPVPPVQSETDAEVTEATDAEDTDAFGASALSDTGGPAEGVAIPRTKKKKQKKERKSRKVVIDDFEMMRVLGKGCAGKVLLVRHKGSQSLYALKAITKRHVLAHQELQHTMTEQAVLKRMARSNSDPFVVKLYWSFHDKENLFLVMVCR